jgi:hypothetical protein
LVEELCGNALRARDRSLERVLGRPLGAQATERAKRPGGGQWTAPGPAPQPRRAEPGSRASKAAAKLSFSKPAKAALPLPEPPAPKGRVPEKKTLLGMAPPKPVAVGLTRTATVPHPVLPSDPTSAPSEKSATMPLEPAEERRLIEALTTEIADSRPSAEIDAAAMQATAAPMTLAPAAARTAVSQHRRAGRIAALAAVLVALPLVVWALWIRARSTERQDVPSQSSALSSVDQVGAPSAVKVSEAPTATPTSAPPTFLRRPAAADQATPNADVLSAPDAAVGASAPNSDSGYESPVSKATTHAAPSTGSTSSSARRPLGAKPLTPAPHRQRAPAPKPGARFRPSGI